MNTSNKTIVMLVLILCAIISFYSKVFAIVANIQFNTVKYSKIGPIAVEPYEYDIWTDAIKFHIDANGYDKKYGDNCPNNFLIYNSNLSAERKSKGYGYYTYRLMALREFIEFCYEQNQDHTNNSATINGGTENESCNYNKLLKISQSTISGNSRALMTRFWNSMMALANVFNEYQDSYFFKANTLKAIEKIQDTLNEEKLDDVGRLTARNLSKNKTTYQGQSSKEYLTILTTYMYSLNREEKLASVGKGDLVPFLYYAENTGDTNPYMIGKYAYIALMNEFLKISGTNYWQPEFDYLYFDNLGFTDSELYEEHDLETLEEWYDETYEKYKNDRGAKQNPLIGSDPDTIISSNYTISNQVEAMKNYVQNVYDELGIEMSINDHIARNELMAKYMMESSRLEDTIKDYNVSIRFIEENLQRGTYIEENTSTAVLSDMQVLTFDHTLNVDGHSDRNGETDIGDGISDKSELGNISRVEITGFVEKMYRSRYGNDMSRYEFKIDEMVANNGYSPDIPNSGHVIKEKDASGKIRVYYRTYDYTSNPMLLDTDFDGIYDNEERDNYKKDNRFKGTTSRIGNIDYYNDFRYFYINNKKYNDELSVMSLMMSNLADGRDITTDQLSGDIDDFLMRFGFANRVNKNKFKISETKNINGRLYMGKKTIQTGAGSREDRRYKDVYGIFLGKFDTIDNYKYLLTNFNEEEIKEYYRNIIEDAVQYIRTNRVATTNDYCYWVCGYGLSGTIAAEVANELIKDGEVYCYTFGATSGSDSSGVNREIKNVINEDDLIPKLNNHNDGFGRSGIIVNDSIYDNYIVEYKKLLNRDNYEAKHKRANSLKQMIINAKDNDDEDYRNTIVDALAKVLCNYSITLNPFTIWHNPNLFFTLNDNLKKIRQGHEMKSYYVLAKSLDGYAENNSNSTWGYIDIDFDAYEEMYEPGENALLLNTIKELGMWYVNHVATYWNEVKRDMANEMAENYYDTYKTATISIIDGVSINIPDGLKATKEIGDKLTYYYPPFSNFETTYEGRNYFKRYVGDDCTGFAQAVIYALSNGDRGQTGDVNTASDGLYNHNASAEKLVKGYDHTDEAMLKLGWEKYYLHTDNKWYRKRKYGGQTEIKKVVDITGYEMSNLGVNFLRPGDLLCTKENGKDGHVEFYFGYIRAHKIITPEIEQFVKVSDLNVSYIEYSNYLDNSGNDIRSENAFSTFGWGDVKSTFPIETSYFTYINTGFRRHCDEVDNRNYTVIWRKN